MNIVEKLINKKNELEERLGTLYQGGSQRKDNLEYKISKIKELIYAYQTNSPSLDLTEVELILNQQIGFSEQKRKILNNLKIKKNPSVIFLIGPPGVGKTSFARLLAQALKKEFFSISLGGLSDSSVLVGKNESSSGTEVGLLTKALLETKNSNPLILLDEIDKVVSYKDDSAIHSCLSSFLDPLHNKEILDHYLDVKLDFSQITFVIAVNDPKKIPNYLLSRMSSFTVELSGYNFEQKKEIVNLFIKQWFEQNINLNPNNFKITPEAIVVLINKTNEKGVRQLKSALESIFDYCILQWTEEADQEKAESKLKIDPDLIHEIIPHEFFNIDSEDNNDSTLEDKNHWKSSQNRELEKLGEKEFKTIKSNSLLILRQIRGLLQEKEYWNYERKINDASSWGEIEIIEKEFLSKLKPKKFIPDPNKNKKDNYQIEIEKLKEQFQDLQKESTNKDRIMFISVIGFLITWGIYGMIKLLKLFRNNK